MKKRSIFTMALTLLLPSLALSAGPSGAQVVSAMNVNSAGIARFFAESGAWLNPDACDLANSIALLPDDNGTPIEHYPEMYALLAGSFLQGKRISGLLDGCVAIDTGGTTIPIVTSIGVYK